MVEDSQEKVLCIFPIAKIRIRHVDEYLNLNGTRVDCNKIFNKHKTKHHKDGHNELSKKHEHCCEGESFFNEFIPFNKQTRLCASVSSSDRGNVPAPIHVCPKCGDV